MKTLNKCIITNNQFIALAKPKPVKRYKKIVSDNFNQYFELSRHKGNQVSNGNHFIVTQFYYDGIYDIY